jgi:hypothetical protein
MSVFHNLTYDFADGTVRSASGRILGTAATLDAVALAFPGETITVLNGGLNPLAKH